MGSLLSAISGSFAKAITLGTMFPVMIVSVLNVLLVAPLLPQTAPIQDLLRRIAIGEEKWGAVALTFIALVITGLLYNLNIPIIRLYEGYPWQNSPVGRWRTKSKTLRLSRIQNLRASVSSLREQIEALSPNDSVLKPLLAEQSSLAVSLNSELPDDEGFVLPTRLGNVIRSFERYSTLAYGIDSIVLWPRLIAKIDSSFASSMDDAKTSFDFMLNTSFLCALSASVVLGVFVSKPMTFSWDSLLPYSWRLALFVALAFLFYSFAVNRAAGWGQQVRAAFDLYRLGLLKDLGYEQKPLTYQEERSMWLDLSAQMLYANSRTDPLPMEQKLTRLVPSPSNLQVTSWREIGTQEPNQRVPVSIRITNHDINDRVELLRVIDAIPEGFKYVPDSVVVVPIPDSKGKIFDVDANVKRFTPLEVCLGPVPSKREVMVTYAIRPQSP